MMNATPAIREGYRTFRCATLAWAVALCLLALGAWPQQNPPQQGGQVTLEELGAPKRPQQQAQVENPIYIDFDNAPLIDVIKAIGLQTGRNFYVAPNAANIKVTVIAHQPVPGDLALDILEAILSANNLQMTRDVNGNLMRIDTANPAAADKLPITTGPQAKLQGYDQQAIHIVTLKYANASEVADLLVKVGSANAEISAYPQSNLLILKDTVDGIRNMLSLLDVIDVAGTGTSVEIFTLEWTRAETLADQITSVLLGEGGGPGEAGQAPRPAIVRRTPAAARVPGQPTAEVVGEEQQVLRIVPDERLNALIVVASEGMMQQVRFLVEQLDSATQPGTNNIHYRELLNADAEDVATALGSVVSAAPSPGGQGGAQPAQAQPFERSVVITFYEQTNALLVLATPQDFKVLDDLITLLDVPRRQVSVEAVVMEVTINDSNELRVESALLNSDNAFALSNTVSIANVLSGGVTSLAGPGGSIGILDGTIDVDTPDGGTITVPNVPFLLRALETVTDVDVLSRPNLLVVDNEEASINVGQNIPIISTLSDVNDQTGFQSRSRVERRDTGVTLTVTPQVQEGDYVALDVDVEVSSPAQSDVGIDPNQVGATIAQSVLQSQVIVGDGQTGIIGGLLREQLDKTVNQVPVLGDLPLLGWLFRGKKTNRSKQNLVVLLTPHIVKRGEDLARITDYRMDQFYNNNVDAIFAKGFVKKISGKHKQRKEGPVSRSGRTRDYTTNFERGRIDR